MNIPEKCFARRDYGCGVFKEGLCEGYDKCSWYRAASEHSASVEASDERLRSLDGAFQEYIATKYYRGHKPWARPAGRPKLEPLTMAEAAAIALTMHSGRENTPEDEQ
jgi:threonine dehydrogenase-like Zn-dependent dehydrogenase